MDEASRSRTWGCCNAPATELVPSGDIGRYYAVLQKWGTTPLAKAIGVFGTHNHGDYPPPAGHEDYRLCTYHRNMYGFAVRAAGGAVVVAAALDKCRQK